MGDTTNSALVPMGHTTTAATASTSTQRRTGRRGLPVRFVTRMSTELSQAVAAAARDDGVTAGAYVRRLLLDRVGVHSPEDARSGRPVRRGEAEDKAIATAIRHLATVSGAVSGNDRAAAQAGLHEARSILIPLVVRRPAP